VPFLLLGVLASSALHLLVSEAFLARVLPRQPLLAATAGAFLGMALPVCECGNVAVARRLLAKGAPLPTAVSFLLAGPVINPIVIVATWIAFSGAPWLVAGRFGLVFAVAVVVALVLHQHPEPRALLNRSVRLEADCCDAHPPERRRPGPLLRHAADELTEMGKYLVLGAAVAAALQTLVPRAALMELGQSPAGSVVALMALAVVLSICSTVDAFVALSFADTFTGGAILAFLAFGPMVDVKSALMYGMVFRPAVVALVLGLCTLLVALVGLFVNLNLSLG
jgi:uncharacterized membrane protein YraQ (UPF0718 family)